MEEGDVPNDGLERDDAAVRPDDAGCEQRVVAHVCPDVEEDLARTKRRDETGRLLPLDRVEIDRGPASLAGERRENEPRPTEGTAKDRVGRSGEQSSGDEPCKSANCFGQVAFIVVFRRRVESAFPGAWRL